MKIVNIIGGLGNQMFQYAFAVALRHAFPDETVKINTKCFRSYPLHNGYELPRLFDVDIPECSVKDLCSAAYPWINYRLWQIGRRVLPRRESMAWDDDYMKYEEFDYSEVKYKKYFDGYWQSPKFFSKYKDEIVRAFRFSDIIDDKNVEILNFIRSSNTAFLHIRRGDYINHPIYGGICTNAYYEKSLKVLTDEYGYRQFIVFSNDIGWCKENLSSLTGDSEVKFIDWNTNKNSFRDMQLMSMCNAGVVANSSFSWWGAWLGNMKVVICPDRWTTVPGHRDDIMPLEWRRIKP